MGAAVFNVAEPTSVFALASGNRATTTYVGKSVIDTAGSTRREIIERDLVQYGIAVLLDPLRSWLDELVPPIGGS